MSCRTWPYRDLHGMVRRSCADESDAKVFLNARSLLNNVECDLESIIIGLARC
jgi:hypothetical protein